MHAEPHRKATTPLRGERNEDRPEQLLEILPHDRLLPWSIEGALSRQANAIHVMAVTTHNHENDYTLTSMLHRHSGATPMLWSINVFLLRCLVAFGVACVCMALFRYPGSRYQGHAAYESALQRYNAANH
jgi:hypothetical protein